MRDKLFKLLRRALNSLHFGEVEGEAHLRQRRRFSLLVISPTENLKCKQFYDPSSKMGGLKRDLIF